MFIQKISKNHEKSCFFMPLSIARYFKLNTEKYHPKNKKYKFLKKMQKKGIFSRKHLVNSKKSSTFAP